MLDCGREGGFYEWTSWHGCLSSEVALKPLKDILNHPDMIFLYGRLTGGYSLLTNGYSLLTND
jgi:hypothetical protein